jgi:Membrane-bound lysozyme-inhibitor of c-type lysozyme
MRLALFAAAVALSACQTPCTAGPAVNDRLVFNCADGSTLAATFTPTELHVEQSGYPALVLASRYAGSGYRYASGGAELRGRGGQAIWARPGDGELFCAAPLRPA